MATAKKASEATKRKPGRPTKYTDETPGQAAKLCALGATDAQLADFFGVTVTTIALWKVQHSEFSDALKRIKEIADERVEQSLYRRAMGFEHDEIDIRVVGTRLVKTPIRRHYPPDTTAMIFWLKNRQPARWRTVPLDGEEEPPPVKVEIVVADARLRPEPGAQPQQAAG